MASAGVALILLVLLGQLEVWTWIHASGQKFWPAFLEFDLEVLLGVPLIVLALLVAIGGCIALRRDLLETKGLPYVPSTPREAAPSMLGALMRTLFGRKRLEFLAGDEVEICSLSEILQTLDDKGTLGGLPFMPEMAVWCGSRARIFRRVDKLNEWIHGTGMKRMPGIVLLEGLRCDGSAHGNCQSACHVRWREDWLRPATRRNASGISLEKSIPSESQLAKLATFTSRRNDAGTGVRFICQATELTAGGKQMRMLDPRHYIRDLFTGNVRLGPLCVGIAIDLFNRVQRKFGSAFPHYSVGSTAASPHLPHQSLDLQPGELVRVRPKREIESTLNNASRNRGLYFDREMLRFCGGEYRVKARVERLIVEKTGELRVLTNPCIILEDVTASGEYLGLNPENEYIFWREVWLERVS